MKAWFCQWIIELAENTTLALLSGEQQLRE
jgi:hypothetical protein